VREGLARFGPRITGTLGDILRDPKRDIAVRMEIPAVLGQFDDARAAEALIENLTTDNPHLKYEVIRGLNRIHARNPALPGLRPEIAERVYMETRGYYEALALLQSVTGGGHGLLQAALREMLDRDLEVIFRLLGLQYSQKDIFFAYSALRSTQADRRLRPSSSWTMC